MMRSAVIFSLVLSGCADYTADDLRGFSCPSEAAFSPVSQLLEKSCGTLDCHGNAARPLRILGRDGLRGDPTLISGGADTTGGERHANWLSACGLEPEVMHLVVLGGLDAEDMLLLRKPIDVVPDQPDVSGEPHDGGPVLRRGGPGYRCILDWLEGRLPDCQEALDNYR